MNRLTKILAIISSCILIFWDLSTLGGLLSVDGGAQIFSSVMNSMLPCGLLFGITALMHLFDKSGKKVLAAITAVVFGLTALIRMFAFGLQIFFISKGQGAKDFDEILLLIEFCGYILLAVASALLMIYIIKGAMRRTSLVLFGVSAVAILVIWVVIQWQSVSQMMFEDKSLAEILLTVFTGDFICSLTTLVSYTLSFACITKVFEDASKSRVN